MSNITDQTIFKITPEGDKELQWRTAGVPKDIRFLLMLINGSRDVRTLRLVCESARESNAVFEYLLVEGLIVDRDHDSSTAMAEPFSSNWSEPVMAYSAPHAPGPAAQDQVFMQAEAYLPPVSADDFNQVVSMPPAADVSSELINHDALNDPALAFSQVFEKSSLPEPQNIASDERAADQRVSSIHLSQAVEIIKQGLGRDADAMIEKLAACQDMASFRETLLKVEQVFREHISHGLADELHRLATRR
jgi:hypothetical protein